MTSKDEKVESQATARQAAAPQPGSGTRAETELPSICSLMWRAHGTHSGVGTHSPEAGVRARGALRVAGVGELVKRRELQRS